MVDNILNCRFKRPDASVRLICFPWAGGGSVFYSNWGKSVHETIEVYGVCLPGRETRYQEPLCNDLDKLLDDITYSIDKICAGKPFALFGHSLGALLVYEVAVLMKQRYNQEPLHIFVSGMSAPHSETRKGNAVDIRNYTNDEFVELLKHFGGTPAELLENRDMISFFLPALRADYELLPQIKDVNPKDRCLLQCPVDVFDGKDDAQHDLQAWKDISTGHLSIKKFSGGHFYLKDPANILTLCDLISKSLGRCLF